MKKRLVDVAVNTKTVLAFLWIALMFLYAYCDILSLYRPGQVQAMLDGKMGFLAATQGSLLGASVLMIVPTLMALVNVFAPAPVARIADIAFGALYFLVTVGNIASETWAYYLVFGAIELTVVLAICVKAIRWPAISNGE